jgi:hypothetical protein
MAKIACCHNCAYSYWDQEHTVECMSLGVMNWPACANHPESLGRMRRVPGRGICVNYRPRLATPEGDVKQIPLGDGYYAYVDAADYEWLSQWTWHLQNGYAVRRENNKVINMHREIMQASKGMEVDHKNRNKLDNTRENLHVCTHAENAQNRRKPRNASTRFWGVSYIKGRAKYMAFVCYKGEVVSCGWFTDEIEAARAHDYKAVALKGESARLNFPEEWPPQRKAEVYAEFQASRKREAKKPRRGKAQTSNRSRPRRTGHKPRRS